MFSTTSLRRVTCRSALFALGLVLAGCTGPKHRTTLERVIVAADQRGFVLEQSQRPFVPWGVNYGNSGRLMEDFWSTNWQTVVDDFGEIRAMGGNVVRVHLQFGAFKRESRTIACGWIWHYDGITVAEYDRMEDAGILTLPQAVWRENLRAFQRLKPEFTSRSIP